MEKESVPVFYVTRDIERALGVWPLPHDFYIVTNRTPYAEEKAKVTNHVFLVQEEKVLDTHELLSRADVVSWIRIKAKQVAPRIVVFKNTPKIEELCGGNEFVLLNPPAKLAQKIEEKISQIEWLGELTSLMPPQRVLPIKDIIWEDKPFIVQFNHGHTGSGTFLIESPEALLRLAGQFPDRIVKKSDYCIGPVYTVTAVVFPNKVLVGNPNYQITGIAPFTTEQFATIGNDWSFAGVHLGAEESAELVRMAEAIGTRMQKDSWRGAFGIDAILDEKTGNFLLLEINARQPAGMVYESWLQTIARDASSVHEATLFEAHVRALLGKSPAETLVKISSGAQIVLRATKEILSRKGAELLGHIRLKQTILEARGLSVISYRNTEPNSDILRIQSAQGLVESHNILNSLGKEIRDTIV